LGFGIWDLELPTSNLFDTSPVPDGFDYRPDFITGDEELALIGEIVTLPFSRVEMRGGVARRRTAHFGWTYGYDARSTEPGPSIPSFLLPLRERVAAWMSVAPEALSEALVTEYPEGAPIGWHRDAPMFDEVAGISLGAPCRMKFRPYLSPNDVRPHGAPRRRTTHEIELEPRSGYLIRGSARREFEHSIPPVDHLRYSVTFRTRRAGLDRLSAG
jgi:alkylated DNA repair dioxygenase AlkB